MRGSTESNVEEKLAARLTFSEVALGTKRSNRDLPFMDLDSADGCSHPTGGDWAKLTGGIPFGITNLNHQNGGSTMFVHTRLWMKREAEYMQN